MTNNPYNAGDVVGIYRGSGWLYGPVVRTILARVHVLIDGRVFVDDWHNCRVQS